MARKEKDLQTSPRSGDKGIAEPKPPKDLWEKLDAEHKSNVPPPNTFSINDYADRYSMTYSEGQSAVQRLLRRGIIEDVGKFGPRRTRHYRVL